MLKIIYSFGAAGCVVVEFFFLFVFPGFLRIELVLLDIVIVIVFVFVLYLLGFIFLIGLFFIFAVYVSFYSHALSLSLALFYSLDLCMFCYASQSVHGYVQVCASSIL